jgi:DNA-binding transcriptional LysR family regulator
MLVSVSGDTSGYVDGVLAEKGLSRRVALSVPNFMLALAALAESDLVAALPDGLVATHAARFGLKSVKAPLPLRRWQLRAVVPQSARADSGIVWLCDAVARAAKARRKKRPPNARE